MIHHGRRHDERGSWDHSWFQPDDFDNDPTDRAAIKMFVKLAVIAGLALVGYLFAR